MCPERAKVIVYDDEPENIDQATKVLTDANHIVLGSAIDFPELDILLKKCKADGTIPDVVLLDDYSNVFERLSGEMAEKMIRGILGSEPVTVAFTRHPLGSYGQYEFKKTDDMQELAKFVTNLPSKNPKLGERVE
jgi:hypothetical protein